MTDPSKMPETPDVAETVSFLRRFAGLMAGGDNAAYLQRAADLLETLTARVVATSDAENLWRYRYETLTHQTDALEAECEALRHDVEGHLEITSAVLAERDALGTMLQAREAELSELRDVLRRERDERAAKSTAHEEALTGLRVAFDQKREALQAAREAELSELRLAFDRERGELQAQLKARADELATFRIGSERELDALKEKVASLEARRAELRSAFDRINHLRNQAIESRNGAEGVVTQKPGPGAEANPLPAQQRGGLEHAAGETNAVVPKTTLRQARAQFEYLAREFIPLGDIASQVMCELGAYTMDLALVDGQPNENLPVGEVARSILAPLSSNRT